MKLVTRGARGANNRGMSTLAWKRLPSPRTKAPAIAHHVRTFHAGGRWLATENFGLVLHEFTRGWKKVADEPAAKDVLKRAAALGERVVAVGGEGQVFELAGRGWKALAPKAKLFGRRMHHLVALEPSGRVVAWAGMVGQRVTNDLFVFEGGRWRLAKPSPRPKEGTRRNDATQWHLLWDTASQRTLRFGRTTVAALVGEQWEELAPRGYARAFKAWQPLPLHADGVTLVLDVESLQLYRFSPAEVTRVATLPALPGARDMDPGLRAAHVSFEPGSRTLFVQSHYLSRDVFSLSLAALFDAQRKSVAPAPPAQTAHFYRVAAGKTEVSPVAKAGFVTADRLPEASLGLLVGAQAWTHEVFLEPPKRSEGMHVGGLPSGVPLNRWPRVAGKPLGLVCQVVEPRLFAPHHGFAVFSPASFGAAKSARANVVLPLTAAMLKQKPVDEPPPGAPLAPANALRPSSGRSKPVWELDPARRALVEADPTLSDTLERWVADERLVETPHDSKLLGVATLATADWPSEAVGGRLLFQLPFDEADLWPGFTGTLFVFETARGAPIAVWRQGSSG